MESELQQAIRAQVAEGKLALTDAALSEFLEQAEGKDHLLREARARGVELTPVKIAMLPNEPTLDQALHAAAQELVRPLTLSDLESGTPRFRPRPEQPAAGLTFE